MPKLTIDGNEIEVPEGSTILEASRKLGIKIPTLCHLEGRSGLDSCGGLGTWNEPHAPWREQLL